MKHLKYALFLILLTPIVPCALYILVLSKIFRMERDDLQDYLSWVDSIGPKPNADTPTNGLTGESTGENG